MSVTLSDLAADQWLYGLYSGDSTLTTLVAGRVYQDVVPQDQNGDLPPSLFPCIVIRPYLQQDVATQNSTIFYHYPDFIITAIGRTAFVRDLEPIAARIHTLTHRAAQTSVSRGLIYTATRLRLHRLAYSDKGVSFRELGGVYRVRTQA